MSNLTPGVLLNLLDGMNSGVKPTSEHRNSLLQVTEIMPVDLDEKHLWPKQGFFVKVSDSSHSTYVSLPSELVLTNEIQLGQFVFVEKLEAGSVAPIAKGVKPVPGRHPFVKMPEPVNMDKMRFDLKGVMGNEMGFMNLDGVSNRGSKLGTPRRGSWVTTRKDIDVCRRRSWVIGPKREDGSNEKLSPMGLKPTRFDHVTPVKKCGSVNSSGSGQKMGLNRRVSLCKLVGSSVGEDKRCVTSSMVKGSEEKSRMIVKDAKAFASPFNSAVGTKTVAPTSSQRTKVVSSPHSSSKTSLSFNLPQNLSLVGKEAVQQHERAQKIALQALRNASSTETLLWSLKSLSTLTKSANADDPTDCFDQFLEFHNQIVQAITNMVSIKAATETTNKDVKDNHILHNIMNNNNNNNNTSKTKSPTHTSQQKSTLFGKHSSSSNSLNETIKLGKRIEKEAGNWFMEFLEQSLEKGMKRSKSNGTKVSQSLVKKVMNWVENEQCDASKRPVHPKAVDICRKLRIKLRNS